MPSSHCWLCHFLISSCPLSALPPAPPVSQTVSSFAGCCCCCGCCSSYASNNTNGSSSSNLPDCLTVIVGSHMLSNWQTRPAPNQFPQNTQQQRQQQRSSISFPTAPSCLLLASCLASSSSSPSATHCKRNILRYSRVFFLLFCSSFHFCFCLSGCLSFALRVYPAAE